MLRNHANQGFVAAAIQVEVTRRDYSNLFIYQILFINFKIYQFTIEIYYH